MNQKKTLLTCLIALVFTLIGLAMAYQFIQDQIQSNLPQQKPVQQQQESVEVSVLNIYLNRGEMVTAEMVESRKIPLAEMNKVIIPFKNHDYLIGKTLKMNVPPGIPLAYSLVQTSSALVFSDLLKPGEKAMTLPMSLHNSIHGFIQPGDFVDLLLTIKKDNQVQTLPLVQKIEILATDAYHTPEIVEKGLPNAPDLKTMTVRVNQKQAQKIAYAQTAGKILTLLRNAKDTHISSPKTLEQKEIIPQKHQVEFIIGKASL